MKEKVKSQNSLLVDSNFYRKESKKIFDELVEQSKAIKDISNNPTEYKKGIIQYSVRGNRFLPISETIKKLPAGWYNYVYDPYCQCILPQLVNVKSEELIKLPIPEYDMVLTDIKKFWDSESDYRKYKFAYKRGIILYGQQGTGKSGLVKLLADNLIKNEGVIFNIGSPDDIFAFENVFNQFREIEPTRNAIAVLEDVDNFIRYGGSCISKLLNILDGNMKFDNIVFIATTNFPEILLSSLVNRPSRFDRRYEISNPDAKAREIYIKAKFKELPESEVKKIVDATDGYTIDMLKELVVTVYVLKYNFDEAVAEIKKLFTFKKGNFDSIEDNELIEGLEQLKITDREEFNKEIEK